jgi:hypothetical protein
MEVPVTLLLITLYVVALCAAWMIAELPGALAAGTAALAYETSGAAQGRRGARRARR